MTFSRYIQFVRSAFFGLFILSLGSVGYMIIEGWSFNESLYMTIITLTTVGFGEVRPLSPEGRFFTIVLLFLGGGFVLYMFTTFTDIILGGKIELILGRRRMDKRLSEIKDHCIIVGFGRMGGTIARMLGREYPLVIIENNPALKEKIEETGHPYVLDDAAADSTLIKAGLERAKTLIAVLPTDAHNVYITLTAKDLNPKIIIIARADHEKAEKRLKRAGANRIIAPYLISAKRITRCLLKPAVMDFLEVLVGEGSSEQIFRFEEVLVRDSSSLAEKTLMESGIRDKCNVIVIAIMKKSGEMEFNPTAARKIQAGEILVVVGDEDGFSCIEKLVSD